MTRCQRWLLGMSAGYVLAMLVAWVGDIGPGRTWELKLNLTRSLPSGLYWCHRIPEEVPIAVGTFVTFVLPDDGCWSCSARRRYARST